MYIVTSSDSNYLVISKSNVHSSGPDTSDRTDYFGHLITHTQPRHPNVNMAGPESAGPSTVNPSPTSTVYQPDSEHEHRASTGRLPDPERGAMSQEKGDVDADAGPSRRGSTSGREEGDKEKGDWVVKWDGPDDPDCPLNTPQWRKWYVSIPLRSWKDIWIR